MKLDFLLFILWHCRIFYLGRYVIKYYANRYNFERSYHLRGQVRS
jgi:hypothetical protein